MDLTSVYQQPRKVKFHDDGANFNKTINSSEFSRKKNKVEHKGKVFKNKNETVVGRNIAKEVANKRKKLKEEQKQKLKDSFNPFKMFKKTKPKGTVA